MLAIEASEYRFPWAVPGTAASFEILYEGKPLAGEPVTLFHEAGFYYGCTQVEVVNSDKAGKVTLAPGEVEAVSDAGATPRRYAGGGGCVLELYGDPGV